MAALECVFSLLLDACSVHQVNMQLLGVHDEPA